MKAHPEQLLHG